MSSALIAGVFLLTLFIGFFLLLFGSTEIVSDKIMQDTINWAEPSPDFIGGKRLILISVKNNVPSVIQGDLNFYGSIKNDIVYEAINSKSGRFRVDKSFFKVISENQSDGSVYYVIYDSTHDVQNLVTTSLIQLLVYMASMAFVVLLAYIMSRRALEPVEDAFKKQRDLIANASHELKTPLTIISTNMSVIKSEPNSTIQENEKWIQSVDTQLERMSGLIQNMLELSKIEQSVIPKELVNLSQIVEGATLSFEAVCFEQNVKLFTDIKENVFIIADKNAIERLVIILLDNAIKYSGQNGKIGCCLDFSNKKARLVVLNTGQSISEEEAKHVFDRFYRADGARSNADKQSFGLGLSIAQATVTAHNGDIQCKGIEGKGTQFQVLLPLAKGTYQTHGKKIATHSLKSISDIYTSEKKDEEDCDCPCKDIDKLL